VWWEVSFPLLVLWRWTRKWALLYGILFHIGIFLTMAIGWFGFYMIDLYGVWAPDEFWERWDAKSARRVGEGVQTGLATRSTITKPAAT
jgi:hypothetical protein